MMLLLLLLELFLTLSTAAPCNFEGSWTYYGGHCYFVAPINNLRNFGDASLECQGRGAYLLSVESEQESTFALDHLIDCRINNTCLLLNANDQYWLGLERITTTSLIDGWKWQSKNPYVWQNWYPGMPRRGIVYARLHYHGQWTEASYWSSARYICERQDTPTTTEIVTTTTTNPTAAGVAGLLSSVLSKATSFPTDAAVNSTTDGFDNIFSMTNRSDNRTGSVENAINTVHFDNEEPFLYKVIGVALVLVVLSILVFVFICIQSGKEGIHRKKPTGHDNKTNKGPTIGDYHPKVLESVDATNGDIPLEGQTPVIGEHAYDSVLPQQLPDLDTEVKYATVSKYKSKSSTVGKAAQGGDIATLTTISESRNEQPLQDDQAGENYEVELV